MQNQHLLPNLMSIPTFADRKGVTKIAIYYRIKKGDIVPVLIGADKDSYIDWNQYKNIEFSDSKKNNIKKPIKKRKKK